MLEESWGMAQDRLGEYKVKIKAINSHLKSIHSRVRSQLVYECRDTVINLYGLNHLLAETKAAKVKELLLYDRFVCEGKCRMGMENRFMAEEIVELIWNKYFVGAKMWGNIDLGFLDRINKQFICLVASVIRHCLKAWSLGTFNQNSVEFKYETAFSIYDRLIKGWEVHSDQVQDLIVANVKAEVKDRLLRKTRPVDQEMVVYSVVGDMDQYEMELRERLFNRRLRRDQPTITRQATPAQSDTSTEQDAQRQD
ncbi:hypothetical protein BDZ91DRAFT_756114 [Kalaharituber pfeilii]|nr:hypothetical protein BDZ91DRAFT_756114 [Kalaharituber pfeilii]